MAQRLHMPPSSRVAANSARRRLRSAALAALAAAAVAYVGAAATACGKASAWAGFPERSRGTDASNRASSADRSRRELATVGGASFIVGAASPANAGLELVKGAETFVTLNNGLKFPRASFGLQIYDDGTAQRLTKTALSVGYRNFFASVLAGNQKGFAKGVKDSGVPREDIFVCGSVLSNRASGFKNSYDLTKQGCDENLRDLSADYVDMIMLDYPGPSCDSQRGQWKAFEEMLAAGKTKSLAVSNFNIASLDCIIKTRGGAIVPTVNQLPMFVGSGFNPQVIEDMAARGVLVQAWSPLGGGRMPLAAKQVCGEIGKKYGKSWAQVALRWILQLGATFCTQSKSKEHFIDDLNVFDFQLSEEDMANLT